MIKWSSEKAEVLMRKRSISLKEIAEMIEAHDIVDVQDVPNQDDHPGQKMFIVMYNGYLHGVPFVMEDNGDLFIKTAFPSRILQKKYGG